MNKKVLLLLVLTFILQVSYSNFASFGKVPSYGGNTHNWGGGNQNNWGGGNQNNWGGWNGGKPHQVPSYHGPTVHSFQNGKNVEIAKQNGGGFFGGFTDSFKAQISGMISQLTSIVSPQATRLKDRLTNSLLAINRILNLLNQFPSKESDFKPLLQTEVKKFLEDLDDIQDLIKCQTNVTVNGNNNAIYGSTGYVNGSGSLVVGNNNAIVGDANTVVGNKTIVAGSSNQVKGNNNVAVGKNNKVSANNAIAFTNNDKIDQSNTLTVGNNTIDLNKLKGNGKTGYLIRD